MYPIRVWLLLLLGVSALAVPLGSVQAQSVPHLLVTWTGQALTAGFDNNVTVTVLNNYYTYPTLYDVDIAVTIPTALTMYGDNHRHYDSLQLGQTVSITFQVYAPSATIGNAYQGSITVSYKALGDISYTQEVHSVSFSVYGWINLIMYGMQLTPSITTPGGNTTISGNVLNSGNLASFDANVSIDSDLVVPSAQSSAFLGEIDPNIPRPFSLLVVFKNNIPPGNYTLTVKASAVDNGKPASPYTTQATATIQISRASPFQNQRGNAGPGGILGILLQILRYLFNAIFGSASPFSLGPPLAVLASDIQQFRIGRYPVGN